MARKTIEVSALRESVNRALNDKNALEFQEENFRQPEAYRMGMAAVLEDALIESGQYRGFQYTDGAQGRDDNTRRRYF